MVRLIAARRWPRPARLVLAAGLSLLAAPAARRRSVTFGTPTATSEFGKEIVFNQPSVIDEPIASAETAAHVPRRARARRSSRSRRRSGTGERLLRETFDVIEDAQFAPNTTLEAQWRLYPTATPDAPVTGPTVTVLYEDDRFDWRTESGDIVRVHWYEGSDRVRGARAQDRRGCGRVLERAARRDRDRTDRLLRLRRRGAVLRRTRTGHARERRWPGERRHPDAVRARDTGRDRRCLGQHRDPARADPSRVRHGGPNPYHFPPRWLNEGVAEYQSQGYDAGYRPDDRVGRPTGTLIPLDGLTGQFPTTYERFSLAYAESTAAVDYLVDTYGQDALVALVTSYASGLTDDEAFSAGPGDRRDRVRRRVAGVGRRGRAHALRTAAGRSRARAGGLDREPGARDDGGSRARRPSVPIRPADRPTSAAARRATGDVRRGGPVRHDRGRGRAVSSGGVAQDAAEA